MDSIEKKLLKIAIICIALFIVVNVCIYANAFLGNPISKALAKRTAENHIAETYPNEDYVVECVEYLFKPGHYYAYITSTGEEPVKFELVISPSGELIRDNYEFREYVKDISDITDDNIELS